MKTIKLSSEIVLTIKGLNKDNSSQKVSEYIKTIESYPDSFEGRGIIMCAGGKTYNANAYANIRLLRHHGVNLPIQVYYLGTKEFDPIFQKLCEPYEVEFIDILPIAEKMGHLNCRGYECKVLAVLFCPFKEVLFIDADNFAVKDPTYLFDSEEYKETGSIFMPDYGSLNQSRPIWDMVGVEYCQSYAKEVESGAIYLDKSKCWEALNLANWMCANSPYWFSEIWGDKETFHMAWLRTNTEYSMPSKGIASLEGTMQQHDFNGKVLFQHRNMAKLNLTYNKPIKGFMNEELLFEYCNELKKLWVEPKYGLSQRDVEDTKDLAGTSWVYHRLNLDKRTLGFGKDGAIISGQQARESEYYIKNGKLHLIGNDGETTAVLHEVPQENIFIGRWLNFEKAVAVLERI